MFCYSFYISIGVRSKLKVREGGLSDILTKEKGKSISANPQNTHLFVWWGGGGLQRCIENFNPVPLAPSVLTPMS